MRSVDWPHQDLTPLGPHGPSPRGTQKPKPWSGPQLGGPHGNGRRRQGSTARLPRIGESWRYGSPVGKPSPPRATLLPRAPAGTGLGDQLALARRRELTGSAVAARSKGECPRPSPNRTIPTPNGSSSDAEAQTPHRDPKSSPERRRRRAPRWQDGELYALGGNLAPFHCPTCAQAT